MWHMMCGRYKTCDIWCVVDTSHIAISYDMWHVMWRYHMSRHIPISYHMWHVMCGRYKSYIPHTPHAISYDMCHVTDDTTCAMWCVYVWHMWCCSISIWYDMCHVTDVTANLDALAACVYVSCLMCETWYTHMRHDTYTQQMIRLSLMP